MNIPESQLVFVVASHRNYRDPFLISYALLFDHGWLTPEGFVVS